MKKFLLILLSLLFAGCGSSFVPSKTNKNVYVSNKLMIANLKHKAKRFKQAYKTCASLRNNGFSDWRLPTMEEMKEIHSSNIGRSLRSGNYWLGEGDSYGYTYRLGFTYGGEAFSRQWPSNHLSKNRTICVRGQSPQANNFIYINNYRKAAEKEEEDFLTWKKKRDKFVAGTPERQRLRRERAARNSSSSYDSQSSSQPCYSGDNTCYEITGRSNGGRAIDIKCIKGNTRNPTSICADSDGDWSYSCTPGSFHYSSFKKAANSYCR